MIFEDTNSFKTNKFSQYLRLISVKKISFETIYNYIVEIKEKIKDTCQNYQITFALIKGDSYILVNAEDYKISSI